MRIRSAGAGVLWVVVAAVSFAALLVGMGALTRPDLSEESASYSADEVRAAREAREQSLDPNNPPRLHVEADYSEGTRAAWYPKGESPIFAELVAEGKLPPVAERVGSEPCVVRAPEGIGKYGGTWVRVANSDGDVSNVADNRLSGVGLMRWSPQGYPIVSHVAKSVSASFDNREFTFTLRKGMRWSDGHPFTAADVMYWWKHECNDTLIMARPPPFMRVRGEVGNIVELGPHRVKFVFPHPNGLFLAKMAGYEGRLPGSAAEHYLRQYHPTVGDKELIARYQAARKLPSPRAVYWDVKDVFNPQCPRLWPWIYRTYKPNPPQTFVRNPYYWMVDTEGNQLPYVDRILYQVKTQGLVALTAANGEVTMQGRHIRYDDYTLLMSQRKRYGFDVRHWYPGDGAKYGISINLNRRIEPDRPDTKHKHELFNDKRFRQALSLAIDRQAISHAEYNGQPEPAMSGPGPGSYFYRPELYKKYSQHDPDRANALLDEIGLTRRDREGYRTFRDGTRMTILLNYCSFTGPGPGQFLVDDWAKVGVRVILRERSRSLFYTEKAGLKHDLTVWGASGEFFPLTDPRYLVPIGAESNYAIAFGRWYEAGGLYGMLARPDIGTEPLKDHPLRKAMEIYDQTAAESDPALQRELFNGVLEIAAENVWHISLCTPTPVLVAVKDGFRNVPVNAVYSWVFQSPSNTGIETYYFDSPSDSALTVAQMKREIIEPTLAADAREAAAEDTESGRKVGGIIRYSFLAVGILLVVLLGVRHPYIGRRALIMVPTLLIISVVVFIVIQLPPGDFVTTRIMQLQESGDVADLEQIKEIEHTFHLKDSLFVQYMRWVGVKWFTSFDREDEGLLQGNMGRSMETSKSVNDIVGDRILLTVLISLGTILFTWALAIPIGIYSAVKQYSVGDYVFTFIGFVGMCVPGFLSALLLMYVSAEWFGVPVSGLFSSQYGAQPEWTWGKVLDLLRHIWIPVAVMGVGGTAGMIRVMRGNLLDELKKPYVTTARAKGVRPLKLLFKYPVRMALNPFVSGIGGLFPVLVSGGAIVAMVLSLPTVGPLMLTALMGEDMYLAGSMLMVLSLLGVVGTLVSDLLLLWLDPRIRFKGGAR